MSKVLKGGNLFKGNTPEVDRQFELRVCIADKYLRVADYPNYENVSTLPDPNVIVPATQYRFGIELLQIDDKITITEILEVAEFEGFM